MPSPDKPLLTGSEELRAKARDRFPDGADDAEARVEFLLECAAAQLAITAASGGGSVEVLADRVGDSEADPASVLSRRELRFLPAARYVVMAQHAASQEQRLAGISQTPQVSEAV